MRELDEKFRKEKGELDEQLIKDKYTLDVIQSENKELQDAKLLLEQEKEQLFSQLSASQNEMMNQRVELKELKQKVRKLEQILYGRGKWKSSTPNDEFNVH